MSFEIYNTEDYRPAEEVELDDVCDSCGNYDERCECHDDETFDEDWRDEIDNEEEELDLDGEDFDLD